MTAKNPTTTTLSERMTWFNKARVAARQGKLDEKRVNKALSVLMQKAARPYVTTATFCSCPDHLYRDESGHQIPRNKLADKTIKHMTCGHMIAKMIERRAEQARAKLEI